jgi:hypothetical protein
MKNILIFFWLCFLTTGAGATSNSGTEVLRYDDFGPQVMAWELLGKEWWQWEPHGSSRPREYDVKVVVYRGINLANVKKKYPVIPSKEQDYRYVKYDKAMRYLDEQLQEDLSDLTAVKLKATRQRLLDRFGTPASVKQKD